MRGGDIHYFQKILIFDSERTWKQAEVLRLIIVAGKKPYHYQINYQSTVFVS